MISKATCHSSLDIPFQPISNSQHHRTPISRVAKKIGNYKFGISGYLLSILQASKMYKYFVFSKNQPSTSSYPITVTWRQEQDAISQDEVGLSKVSSFCFPSMLDVVDFFSSCIYLSCPSLKKVDPRWLLIFGRAAIVGTSSKHWASAIKIRSESLSLPRL